MKTKTKPEIIKVNREDLETLNDYLTMAYDQEYFKSYDIATEAFAREEIGYGVYLLNTLAELDKAIEKMREILGEDK